MDNFNNIFDKYNNKSLKDESWLDPSDAIFAAIEKEIEEKPKKKRAVWLYWFGSLVLLVGVVLFSFNYLNQSVSNTNQIKYSDNKPVVNSIEEANVLMTNTSENTSIGKINKIENIDHPISKDQSKIAESTPIVKPRQEVNFQNEITIQRNQKTQIDFSAKNQGSEFSKLMMSQTIGSPIQKTNRSNSLTSSQNTLDRVRFNVSSLNRI